MVPDLDPQAWFAAFEASISEIRARKTASSQHTSAVNDETANGDGGESKSERSLEVRMEADEGIPHIIPGKLPED